MSEKSSIEWTDSSWNPIRARRYGLGADAAKVGWHCEKVSPGCTNCYAERLNKRLGTGLAYKPTNTQFIEPFLDEDVLTAPLRWRKPRKIFVCSMTDLFGEWVPDEWIDRVFAVMALAPGHTFQVLTKRAERMRHWFNRTASGADRETVVYESKPGFTEKGGRIFWPGWPLPNVWLGVSAEDQQRLDERVQDLFQTPAAVRFVSAEPLLGPVQFDWAPKRFNEREIDWVIVGGESGPGARPMDIAWARDIVRQCREAGVSCFVKQMGANVQDRNDSLSTQNPADLDCQWPEPDTGWDDRIGGNIERDLSGYRDDYQGAPIRIRLKDPKGGDPAEWPEDLRVREFPTVMIPEEE